MDGIAVWFEAELCKGVWIDTKPAREDCAWQQGLYHVPGRIELQVGDKIHLTCSFWGEDLAFQLRLGNQCSPGNPLVVDSSAFDSQCFAVRWSHLSFAADGIGTVLSEEQWAELSDTIWWEGVRRALQEAADRATPQAPVIIVDMNCGCAPVSVAARMAGALGLQVVASTSDIDKDCHALIVADILGPGGSIRPATVASLAELKKIHHPPMAMTAVPASLHVWIRGLEAPSVIRGLSVLADRQCGVDVSAMDLWATASFQDEDLSSARALTEARIVLDLDLLNLDLIEHRICLPIVHEGQLNVLHYWVEADMSISHAHCISTFADRPLGRRQAGVRVPAFKLTCNQEVELSVRLSPIVGLVLKVVTVSDNR